MVFLPRPEVLQSCVDASAVPPVTVLTLRWNHDAPGTAERTWHLPAHVAIKSEAPRRFGIGVHSRGDGTHQVRVVWNELQLSWEQLTAHQVMTGCLAQLLGALGNDLWHMLGRPLARAA